VLPLGSNGATLTIRALTGWPSLASGRRIWLRRRAVAWALAFAPLFQVVPSTVALLQPTSHQATKSGDSAHATSAPDAPPDWPGLTRVAISDLDHPAPLATWLVGRRELDTGVDLPPTIERP
jgi:hypothetical protein